MTSKTKILFKEWMPDLPDYDNPGLVTANNVLPLRSTYKSFSPLAGSISSQTTNSFQDAGTASPVAGFVCKTNNISFGQTLGTVAIGTDGHLYRFGSKSVLGIAELKWYRINPNSSGNSLFGRRFAQYGDILYAASSVTSGFLGSTTANNITETITVDASMNTVSGSPAQVSHLAVVNQFMVAAVNNSVQPRLQWSSIDDPADWPTPGSSTANARQAGEQYMQPVYGDIHAVTNGDEFGLVFQQNAITRMTYVGGSVVWHFDRIVENIGTRFPWGVVQSKNLTYFADKKGFYVTDGYTVTNISDNKVTKYFTDKLVGFTESELGRSRMQGAIDSKNGLIYWSIPDQVTTPSYSTGFVIYNPMENRWASASQNSYAIFSGPISDEMYGFYSSASCGTLTGTAGAAILETGDIEGNTGGFMRVAGVLPLVDATIGAVTVALGSRNHLGNAVTYTSETTANSQSNFADFRSEGRYQRVRLTVNGTFNSAQGVIVRAVGTGEK